MPFSNFSPETHINNRFEGRAKWGQSPLKYKIFIKNHSNTNFKKYILEKAKKGPDIYCRVDEEAEQLIVAAEIVALRKKYKLTQVQLAKKAQTSQSALAQIEAGRRSPTTDTLIKISNAVNTKLKISFSKIT